MKSPCCIESGKYCPNTLSCSMILRSACSRGHSHKSVMVNEVQAQKDTQKKRRHKKISSDNLTSSDPPNNQIQLDAFWESSLKKLALTSTKTLSIFKENLYNHFEVSENQKSVFLRKNEQDYNCIKQLHFSKTSTPVYSVSINDINNCKNFHKESNLLEKDSNLNAMSTMSRTRNLQRSNLRALSGSESEEDSPFLGNREKLKKARKAESVARLKSAAKNFSQVDSNANIYGSSNHVTSTQSVSTSSAFRKDGSASSFNQYSSNTPTGSFIPNQRSFSPDSPQVDKSVVQFSAFDRLRWLLWRYIYLKIITSVNFDVWLLSRLHDKKHKAVMILLLPLLIYLLYNITYGDMGLLSKSFDLISSILFSLVSSICSLISYPYIQSQELLGESSFSCPNVLPSNAIFTSFGGWFATLSDFFVKTEESTSFVSKTNIQSSYPVDDKPIRAESLGGKMSREEIRSVVVEVLKEKLNDFESRIQSDNLKAKGETTRFQKEISDLQFHFQSLSGTLKQLETDFHKMEKSAAVNNVDSSSAKHNQHFTMLNEKMRAFEVKLEQFGDHKMSISDFAASIEKHIVAAFRNVIEGEENVHSRYHFFSEWLNSKITDPTKISSEINASFEMLKAQLKSDSRQDKESLKVIEGIVQHYIESLKTNLTVMGSTAGFDDSLSVQDMRRIAKEAIMLYDADKTGLVDYALESAGGSVLGTRCSESYVEKNGKYSVFGFPLWSDQNSPRTAIQPNVQPGKCWAFKGSQGFLVIQLSYTIHPTGFTLEHIPVSLSPTGSIDSAPKDFSVWGLASETESEGMLLGRYTFDQNGEPLQYFPVQNLTPPFLFIELKIHSNYGNLEYTCLYRFRVHGTQVK